MAALRARWEAGLPAFGIWAALPTAFAVEALPHIAAGVEIDAGRAE
jgi:hypothetical protein